MLLKRILKKEHFCHLHGCWGQFAGQPTCTGAAGAVPQPGSLGFPELERIALDKLCKVWVCVAVQSGNRCPLFCGAMGEDLTAFLGLEGMGLMAGDAPGMGAAWGWCYFRAMTMIKRAEAQLLLGKTEN